MILLALAPLAASVLLLGAMAVPAVVAVAPAWLAPWADPTSLIPLAVHAAAAVLAAIAWRVHARRRRLGFTVPAAGVGIVIVVLLGLAAYGPCDGGGQSPVAAALIRAASLLFGNYETGPFGVEAGCSAGVPPALQAARLTMIAVLAIGALGAVAALLGGRLDRLAVRRASRVDLVLGLDEAGLPLLGALAARRDGGVLAVVAEDPAASWVAAARRLGARIVSLNRDDHDGLAALLRRRDGTALRSVTALGPAPSANIAAVEALRASLGGTAGRGPVRVLVRIDDPWQAEEWRRGVGLGDAATVAGSGAANDVAGSGAASGIDDWPCDAIGGFDVLAVELADRIRGFGAVLVTGGGPLALALLAELDQRVREQAALGQEPVAPEVRLLGPAADDLLAEHRLRAARFGNDAGFGMSAVVATADHEEVLRHGDAATGPLAVVVADGDAALATAVAVRRPAWSVVVRDDRESGVAARPTVAGLLPAGPTIVADADVPIDAWERVARLAHEHYRRGREDSTAESALPWDEGLPGFYRESNVRQVLTALRGATAVGRVWGAAEATPSLPSGAELDRLAAIEHASWCEQYRAAGWRHGPQRDRAARRHPDLVPWEALSEGSRAGTRDGVAATFALLWALGYRSRRVEDAPTDAEAGWSRFARRGEVTALRRETPWEWTADDGSTMTAGAGHWEVVDDEGRTWSVEPEAFALTYEHVSGDRWRRSGEVDARLLAAPETIETLEGPVAAAAGDWLVRGPGGEQWPVRPDRFARGYRPLDP